MLSTQISQDERQAFWDNIASNFSGTQDSYSTQIYGEGEWRLFTKYFSDLKGKKVLKLDLFNEVHNTTGILDKALEAEMDVSGIDISPVLTAKAVENYKKKGYEPNFVVGDMRNMPLPDNTFDYLYTMGTIEHVPDPENAVREIHRVLKPGGVAVIGVPYRFDIFGRAAVAWVGNKTGIFPYGDEMCFSWKEFKKLISVADFEIIDRSGAYFMPWPLRFADGILHQYAITRPVTWLLRPFLYICKKLEGIDWLLRHTGLVAYIVRKK